MTVSTNFRVDAARAVVFAETRGMTSFRELMDSFACLLDHPSYRSGMRLLLDMSDVTPSLVRPDIIRIAAFVNEHAAKIGALKMAVVVPKDASFGMAQEQKVELEGSPIELEVFRAVGEARQWLGLPPDDPEDGRAAPPIGED